MSQGENDEEDLTRKQRREQARTERKAAEQAAVSDAAKRRRLAQLGGAVAVVVVAVVVILIVTSGGSSSSKPVKEGSHKETEQVALVNSTLAGTTQSANVLGNPNAPVTMQYYGDLECPICKDFTLGALPAIIQKWVKSGKLKIEYRSLETATREPETFRTQQIAALAAGKQNKAWNFIETFYHEQGEEDSGYVNEAYLQSLARQVPGLNLTKWQTDRGDQKLQAQLAVDTQEANQNGFTGTPSFLIGKSGSGLKKYEYSSLTDPSGFNEAIEKALNS
jgi:protein-disulfide isomerase